MYKINFDFKMSFYLFESEFKILMLLQTLEPNDHFDVTSFVSHPWIFRDAETHMKLNCGSREVFDCPEVRQLCSKLIIDF